MDASSQGRALERLSADVVPNNARMCPIGVTVAITNWNHEYVLPRSILSALRTTRRLRGHGISGEVLVVDDGSRDGSLPLLRQLEALHFDEGLRVLALARNEGLPAARNRALECATYRYIVFLDADNELVSENVHDFYRAITETRAAVVYGNVLVQNELVHTADAISNEVFQDRMFESNYIDALALYDRLQIIDNGGYLSSVQMESREDWELYLHLATGGRMVIFVPIIFGIYHDIPRSMNKDAEFTHGSQQMYVKRVFDQLGIREFMPIKTRHLRFHPDIGFI